jgi:hypothetical protein
MLELDPPVNTGGFSIPAKAIAATREAPKRNSLFTQASFAVNATDALEETTLMV